MPYPSRAVALLLALMPTIAVGARDEFGPQPGIAFGQTLVALPNRPICSELHQFATQRWVDERYVSSERKKLEPFKTDSIVIMRNGRVVYEWYDGMVGPRTLHTLWSASKMITATLLARAIATGATYQGRAVALDTPLATFFPAPAFLATRPEQRATYERATLRNLVEMSANFDWKEWYDGDLASSSFFPMLYGEGTGDMASFALRTPFHAEGPDGRWNYSGGNMNMLSAILKKIYGPRYDNMPWELLFNPLGIRDARVERDLSGQFVGSSYFYVSALDMAKLGEMYRRGGLSPRGVQMLPEGWIEAAQRLAPALSQTASDLPTIKKLGAQGGRIFWLNTPIPREDGQFVEIGTGRRILYPMEMPQAPSDMYFAGGHYGQIIVVIPSEGLVIARTGYDSTYWDHIQPLAVKTKGCFDPNYSDAQIWPARVDLVPPSAGPKTNFIQDVIEGARSAPGLISSVNWAADQGLIEKVVAKELCSFLFVQGGYDAARTRVVPGGPSAGEIATQSYLERSGIPGILRTLLMGDDTIYVDPGQKAASVVRNARAPQGGLRATARRERDPRFGCQLVEQARTGSLTAR